MRNWDVVCESTPGSGAEMEHITRMLHDLCQPLTVLQCRLEIAELVGTAEAYREAVDLGLVECGRMMEAVARMRETVRASQQAGEMANRSRG